MERSSRFRILRAWCSIIDVRTLLIIDAICAIGGILLNHNIVTSIAGVPIIIPLYPNAFLIMIMGIATALFCAPQISLLPDPIRNKIMRLVWSVVVQIPAFIALYLTDISCSVEVQTMHMRIYCISFIGGMIMVLFRKSELAWLIPFCIACICLQLSLSGFLFENYVNFNIFSLSNPTTITNAQLEIVIAICCALYAVVGSSKRLHSSWTR